MANEPERPIEKLLRATAKKRGGDGGAPLELHPATRRLLQGEVSRQYAKAGPDRRSFSVWPGRYWPRFAWGVGMSAVLGLTVWLLVPMPGRNARHAELARNQPVPLVAPPKRALLPPAATPAPAPTPTAAETETKAKALASADSFAPASRKPAAEVALQTQPFAKDSVGSVTGRETRERLTVAATEPPVNRQPAVGGQLAAATSMPAAAPAVTLNGVSGRPMGSVGQPVLTAAAPAASALPSSVVAAPGAAAVQSPDESAKLAFDRPDQSGFSYRALATTPKDSSSLLAAAPTNIFLISAAADRRIAGSSTATQWFAQMTPTTNTKLFVDDKAASARPVLAAFRVEQTGRQLRIIDGDGSVYTGYLQIADAARRQPAVNAPASFGSRASATRGAALKEESTARVDADQLLPQTYSFRVMGTNRSLQQKVVFTGNFLAATNGILIHPATNASTLGGSVVGYRGAGAQPTLLPLPNSRIAGKVVIGNGKPFDINARPATP